MRQVRILSIEDDPDDLSLILRVLERAGYEVEASRVSGFDELVELKGSLFDLALVDSGGLENPSQAIADLEVEFPYVPVIIVSGTSDPGLARKLILSGARDWVDKSDLDRLPIVFERELRNRDMLLEKLSAEIELRESIARLRSMFDSTAVGMAMLTTSRRFSKANEALALLVGYELNDLAGETWDHFVHPEDQDAYLSAYEAFRSGELDSWRLDGRIRQSDDSYKWLGITLSATRDQSGQLLYMVLVAQDIEDRMRALRQADASARFSGAVLDSVQEGVIALDAEGRCTVVNRKAAAILESSVEDLAGIDFHLRIHPDDTGGECDLSSAIRNRRSISGETLFDIPDKQPVIVHYSIAPLGAEGQGFVTSFRDVTEERRLQERIDEMIRLDSLGKTAGKIAHEFNNVLMGIRPFGEVILRRSAGDPLLEDAARRIEYSVARGVRVTSEILRFARPAKPERTRISVEEILDELERETSSTLKGSMCTIEVRHNAGDAFFNVDRFQLMQVLVNLVMNARDAMPGGGRVLVEAQLHEPGFVDLEVTDSGSGISPEHLPSIFEPMFTTKSRGTGLGLAVARQIVSAHRGTIEARSSLGEGSTFRVRLPLLET